MEPAGNSSDTRNLIIYPNIHLVWIYLVPFIGAVCTNASLSKHSMIDVGRARSHHTSHRTVAFAKEIPFFFKKSPGIGLHRITCSSRKPTVAKLSTVDQLSHLRDLDIRLYTPLNNRAADYWFRITSIQYPETVKNCISGNRWSWQRISVRVCWPWFHSKLSSSSLF